MVCTGFKQPPLQEYRRAQLKRMPSGRLKRTTGIGECPHCHGLYVTRLNPRLPNQGRYAVSGVYVGYHHDLRQCSAATKAQKARQKQRWETWRTLGGIHNETRNLVSPFINVGTVDQQVRVIENTNAVTSITYGGLGTHTYATGSAAQTFRIELESSTPGPVQMFSMQEGRQYWLFAINGNYYQYPDRTVTVLTDYATWNSWNNSITVSNTTRVESGVTWNNWINNNVTIASGNIVTNHLYTAPRPDPEEVRRRRQQEAEELFRRTEAQNKAKAEAVARAEKTLLSFLTPEQRDEYRTRRHFHVRGSRGTLYRILRGSSGNVRQVLSEADDDRGLHAFCAHPQLSVVGEDGRRGILPHEDVMLAQALHLQLDEDAFLAVANRHW